MGAAARKVKFVVVGDGGVGKTCLCWRYIKHEIPPAYVPTIFDNYVVKVTVDGREINLQLWDTAGQEDLETIRTMSYANTDCFILCYSIGEPASFENARTKWIAELRAGAPEALYVICATKKDLRDGRRVCVGESDGRAFAEQIEGTYVECSAMSEEGVKHVFDAALQTVLRPRTQKKAGKRCGVA